MSELFVIELVVLVFVESLEDEVRVDAVLLHGILQLPQDHDSPRAQLHLGLGLILDVENFMRKDLVPADAAGFLNHQAFSNEIFDLGTDRLLVRESQLLRLNIPEETIHVPAAPGCFSE